MGWRNSRSTSSETAKKQTHLLKNLLAAPATLVTVVNKLVVQASKLWLVFPLLTDILSFSGIPEEQHPSKYKHLGKLPLSCCTLCPKYGKPVHPHQAGSLESYFQLPLLRLFCVLGLITGITTWFRLTQAKVCFWILWSHLHSHYASKGQKGAGLIMQPSWQSMLFMSAS